MEIRRLGRTGHLSTIAVFGAAGLSNVTQDQADKAMQQIIDAGVNHIDIAPSYGEAELRVGPWMPDHRKNFFLGCKTTERKKEAAFAELEASLRRLQVDRFDLYQLHAVNTFEELDMCTAPGGALEAAILARDQGLTSFIGITGHGNDSPKIYLEALRRFDFDSVLFPINPVQYGILEYRRYAEKLVAVCKEKDVGTMIIKTVAKQGWGGRDRTYDTWYEPFDKMDRIQEGVNFALSQDITALCTAGDVRILPLFLEACKQFVPLSENEQEALIADHHQFKTIFDEHSI